MRDDPIDDEEATLVVELGDTSRRDALEASVRELDGSVVRDLRFRAVLVTVPESGVSSLCEFDGLARIETGETLSLGVDEDATLPRDDDDGDALDLGRSELEPDGDERR